MGRFFDDDDELNFDEESLEEEDDSEDGGVNSLVDKMGPNDVLCTDDSAVFDGVDYFGRATLQVFVDKEGRYFASDEEPRYNPYTGKKIRAFLSLDDVDIS